MVKIKDFTLASKNLGGRASPCPTVLPPMSRLLLRGSFFTNMFLRNGDLLALVRSVLIVSKHVIVKTVM